MFKRRLLIFLLLCVLIPVLSTAEGVTIIRHKNETNLIIDPESFSNAENSGVEIEIAGEGSIELKSDEKSSKFTFSTGDRAEKIYLYTSLTGFFPQLISITDVNMDFDILSAAIIEKAAQAPSADIGHIIFSDFKPDANKNWVVYSWNILPEILIFDTEDYATQARIFKRLAFYVEKPGYTGKLLSNDELEGKHGWNAHDYRPEDLADFFTQAAETKFDLNKEEIELRSLLIGNGILKTDIEERIFSAGTGAVLSVSRETLPNWRYRFLTHECLHGIFFTNTEFRESMFEAFDELENEEIEFWKRLLDYRRYDVENQYLLVNEYMAFSLQQPIEEVDEYFKGFLYKRMLAARPYESEFIANFDRNFSQSFISTVTKIEKILYSHTGRIAGHLANVYPAEVGESFFNLFPPI